MTVSRDTYIAAHAGRIGWQVPAPGRRALSAFSLVAGTGAAGSMRCCCRPSRTALPEAHADALEKQLGIPVLLVDGEMMSWYGSRAIEDTM
jgi:hypothetical protein